MTNCVLEDSYHVLICTNRAQCGQKFSQNTFKTINASKLNKLPTETMFLLSVTSNITFTNCGQHKWTEVRCCQAARQHANNMS